MDKALIEAVCQAMPDPVTPYWKDRQRIAEEVIPVVLERAASVSESRQQMHRNGIDKKGFKPLNALARRIAYEIRNLGASQ